MNNENEKNFLSTIVNYAVVIRTDFETISQIKKEMQRYDNVEIVYQKYSLFRLMIREEGEKDDN